MCTAIHLTTTCHYFGRTLDLDCSYGEEVCILPRRYPLTFRRMGELREHYAIIGTASVVEGTPLLYDGANEHGLAMAGLNFPGNAHYAPPADGRDNVTPFEFIPWILGRCKTVAEAKGLLARLHLVNIPFSEHLPLSPLHWMISDRECSVVVEQMEDGLHVYDNPVGVMTNNPPFPYQLFALNNYRHLRPDNGEAHFTPGVVPDAYSKGLGALGLPGDPSSMSRFARAAFGVTNSVCEGDEGASVNQFFHLLDSVGVARGLCRTDAGDWHFTIYSSCINTDRGLYYYTTYGDRRIRCVDLHHVPLDGETVSRYPMKTEWEHVREN